MNTYTAPSDGWVCFHCGERFRTEGAARDHFGATPNVETGCLLKVRVGNERGWLMEIRRLQDRVAEFEGAWKPVVGRNGQI